MKRVPVLLSLFLILLTLTGCQEAEPEQTPELSFQQRYAAAVEREQHLLSNMGMTYMARGTQNITDEFLPEAAAKLARALNTSQLKAELLLRKKMMEAALRAEDEYVEEYGYGTIVLVLRACSAWSIVRDVMESKPAALRNNYFAGEK